MAQGTAKIFLETSNYIRDKTVDIDGGSWKIMLCSDPISALLVGETTPKRDVGNINEVAATGGYTPDGGIALTLDVSEAAGLFTFKVNTTTHPSGIISWTKAASSPIDIKSAVLYDDAAANDECIAFWDMTTNGGTTPLSLVAVSIDLKLGAAGGNAGEMFTWQINN